VTTRARVQHHPFQISVTHLPPWRATVPSSQPTLSHWSQLAAHLPDRRCGRPHIEARRRHHSLRLVHTVCRRTTLRLRESCWRSHSIPTTSTRHSVAPVLRPSLSPTAHLSDFGPPSHITAFRSKTSIPLHLHKIRPSPPVTLLQSFLCLEDPPPQPSFRHHLHHPAASRHDHAATVSPSLQAVRASKPHCSYT
jgi:hypothetical protein